MHRGVTGGQDPKAERGAGCCRFKRWGSCLFWLVHFTKVTTDVNVNAGVTQWWPDFSA